MRDLSTWSLSFGAVLVLGARRPAWHVPLLTLAVLLQGAGNSALVNHLAEHRRGRPGEHGHRERGGAGDRALACCCGCSPARCAAEGHPGRGVFVTGATGAIGRPLLPRLLQAGHEVTAMTRSPGGGNRRCGDGASRRWSATRSTPSSSSRGSGRPARGARQPARRLLPRWTRASRAGRCRAPTGCGARPRRSSQRGGPGRGRPAVVASVWFVSGPTAGRGRRGSPLVSSTPRSRLDRRGRVRRAGAGHRAGGQGLEGLVLRYGFLLGRARRSRPPTAPPPARSPGAATR